MSKPFHSLARRRCGRSFALAVTLFGVLVQPAVGIRAQEPVFQPPSPGMPIGEVVVEPATPYPLGPEYEMPPYYTPGAPYLEGEEVYIDEGFCPQPPPQGPPPGTRPGVFQKGSVVASWMPGWGGRDGYGISQLGANLVFGFPFPDRESPLLVTPDYTLNFLDGPDFLPVPSRLHEASVDFHHFRPLAEDWTFDAAVTIGAYADDESFNSSDAIRVSGRALGIYQADPYTKWIFGAVYVNRANATLLPAIGYIYATEDKSVELVFPRPRYAWRTWSNGPPGHDERWLFVQGEFGGGIWAIERPNGLSDTLSYSDLRILFGTERKIVGGVSHRWEVGYVFGRELEFERGGGTFDVDPTMFLRTGWTY